MLRLILNVYPRYTWSSCPIPSISKGIKKTHSEEYHQEKAEQETATVKKPWRALRCLPWHRTSQVKKKILKNRTSSPLRRYHLLKTPLPLLNIPLFCCGVPATPTSIGPVLAGLAPGPGPEPAPTLDPDPAIPEHLSLDAAREPGRTIGVMPNVKGDVLLLVVEVEAGGLRIW